MNIYIVVRVQTGRNKSFYAYSFVKISVDLYMRNDKHMYMHTYMSIDAYILIRIDAKFYISVCVYQFMI